MDCNSFSCFLCCGCGKHHFVMCQEQQGLGRGMTVSTGALLIQQQHFLLDIELTFHQATRHLSVLHCWILWQCRSGRVLCDSGTLCGVFHVTPINSVTFDWTSDLPLQGKDSACSIMIASTRSTTVLVQSLCMLRRQCSGNALAAASPGQQPRTQQVQSNMCRALNCVESCCGKRKS